MRGQKDGLDRRSGSILESMLNMRNSFYLDPDFFITWSMLAAGTGPARLLEGRRAWMHTAYRVYSGGLPWVMVGGIVDRMICLFVLFKEEGIILKRFPAESLTVLLFAAVWVLPGIVVWKRQMNSLTGPTWSLYEEMCKRNFKRNSFTSSLAFLCFPLAFLFVSGCFREVFDWATGAHWAAQVYGGQGMALMVVLLRLAGYIAGLISFMGVSAQVCLACALHGHDLLCYS